MAYGDVIMMMMQFSLMFVLVGVENRECVCMVEHRVWVCVVEPPRMHA